MKSLEDQTLSQTVTVAVEDEKSANRYSTNILQICKNCKMLIKSSLCFVGVGCKNSYGCQKACINCSSENKLVQSCIKFIIFISAPRRNQAPGLSSDGETWPLHQVIY